MNLHDLHTKGDQELLSFLAEEIATEKKAQRTVKLPTTLDDFKITVDQSDVTLTKKFNKEEITVSLNVNHSVDADASDDPNATQKNEQGEVTEMRSRPSFDVDIKKGTQTLNFSCSFVREDTTTDSQEEYHDVFVIEEMSLTEGDDDEKIYVVAGDILDGYLYDLFMNMLEERGITIEFVDKLSDYCTSYEHQLYVTLLQKLEGFVGSK
jgi:complement component 1 Q subcomponent-binding protein